MAYEFSENIQRGILYFLKSNKDFYLQIINQFSVNNEFSLLLIGLKNTETTNFINKIKLEIPYLEFKDHNLIDVKLKSFDYFNNLSFDACFIFDLIVPFNVDNLLLTSNPITYKLIFVLIGLLFT